jgi:hypothetical protein
VVRTTSDAEPAGLHLAQALLAQLTAFWDSHVAAGPPEGADPFELPLTQTGEDQTGDAVNPYWEIVRSLPRWPLSGEPCANPHIPGLPALRGIKDLLRRNFAWAIPSPGDIRWIANTVRAHQVAAVTEVGAGAGYWAWQLTQAGIGVDATDANPPSETYVPIRRAEAAAAASASGARVLLLVWPPLDDSMAADALRLFRGDLLIYCGEEATGCTAGDDFFDLLDEAWERVGTSPHHRTWQACDDILAAWRRR